MILEGQPERLALQITAGVAFYINPSIGAISGAYSGKALLISFMIQPLLDIT
jgi:hypothetical protein